MPLIMHGNWTVAIKEKHAAFPQRFIVSGANNGNGTYEAPHAPVYVTGDTWSIRIQSKPIASDWTDSEYQITFPVAASGQYHFDVQSNDVWAGDADFDDLVLTCSTPVTETDFLVYGNVSTYAGCLYNPCARYHLQIESAAALKNALRYPALKDAIEKLYPKHIPLPPIPQPDPPVDVPAGLLTQASFKPVVIPLQDETLIPVKKGQIVKREAIETKKAAKNTTSSETSTVLRTLDVARANKQVVEIDRAALIKIRDMNLNLCTTDPIVNGALRFQEYDRTLAELGGGAYSGEGLREELGQTSTDRNGNYIFRFRRSLAQLIDETNTDVALGENESLYALPDLIVQVAGASMAGDVPYETAPYWNVPTLKRINICIPSQYWHTPTGCHGKPISHIGFIPLGKTASVKLDNDGRVTCTDNSKADIPQTDCAAWWGTLRMSACIGKYDKVPHYTLEYRARRPDFSWTAWSIYQETLMLDNWKTVPSAWIATKVGPFVQTLEINKGAPKQEVLAYNNIQGNMDWSGPDWFIKAIIPSWLYSYLGGPGSVEFRLKAYDSTGKQIQLWNDPVTSAPLFQDTVRLYIDHTGPELNFKEVSIGTATTNPCPLFVLTEPEMVSATLNLKFLAVQRQGFLGSYNLSLTKCNTPNFPVEDLVGAHVLNPVYVPSAGSCAGLYGTLFGVDPAADSNDYVSVGLNPIGSTPWLEANESVSSFTLNLSASVRRTDGHSASYPVGYGPMQYNFVIKRPG